MRQRGMTLVELLVSMAMMALMVTGIAALFLNGLRSFQKTTTDTNLSQTNAQGMRRVVETLRGAINISITNEGKKISYNRPVVSSVVDPTTAEREITIPVVSDGVARSFTVASGQLKDDVTGRILIKGIRAQDPDPSSSQYNQAYSPFQLTTIGSYKAVTVNFITSESVLGSERYARMKTTVVIRNQ